MRARAKQKQEKDSLTGDLVIAMCLCMFLLYFCRGNSPYGYVLFPEEEEEAGA